LNDVVLFRHHQRGEKAPDLIMVSNDSDNEGLVPKYIDNFITKFDTAPNVDAMLGQLDWDPKSYIRNPLIHIGTRLFQYIEIQSRAKREHIASSGANFAIRSSIYAAIGGYTGDLKIGEDNDIGKKIISARHGAKEHIPIAFAGVLSRLYTSSRRAEKVWKEGRLTPIEQWSKGFGATENAVRKAEWEEIRIDFDNKEEVNKFITDLEHVINRTITYWGKQTTDHFLRRALGWLGIKYRIDGNYAIKITDASALLERLKLYQEEGLKILKRKTGQLKAKKNKAQKIQ